MTLIPVQVRPPAVPPQQLVSPQRDEPLGGAGLHRHGLPRVPRPQARHQPGRVHHERQHHSVRDVHCTLTYNFISEEEAGRWLDMFLRILPRGPKSVSRDTDKMIM